MNKWHVFLVVFVALISTSVLANDREAILTVVDNFYIGDHKGSKKHRELSLHPLGAYRYVNSSGEYKEYKFTFTEGNADTSYQEELLSVDIYENVALVRLRLAFKDKVIPEYKLMTLHKSTKGWLITSISWGMGVNIH